MEQHNFPHEAIYKALFPKEEFKAMYDAYPRWVTAPSKEGKREGKDEVLKEQIASLTTRLSERFGFVQKL